MSSKPTPYAYYPIRQSSDEEETEELRVGAQFQRYMKAKKRRPTTAASTSIATTCTTEEGEEEQYVPVDELAAIAEGTDI